MKSPDAHSTQSIDIGEGRFSILLDGPAKPRAGYVLAHGAGAGMNHAFLKAVASGLDERGIACLRYEFPYMERGASRPDKPSEAQARVREAVTEAARRWPGLPLFAGGKSYGGRMTSQAQAEKPLPGVKGIVFLGFPLHAPGKPSDERGAHLSGIKVPMLFLQGSRDELASLDLLKPVVAKLKDATLQVFEDVDHSFQVPARSGRRSADVMVQVLDQMTFWINARL